MHRSSMIGICVAVFTFSLPKTKAATVPVTCGSVVKLQHLKTKALLHSHEVTYGSGSGQQSVTTSFDSVDANSLWQIHSIQEQECDQGVSIKNGQKIRLQHARTGKWLHSHHFASPLTQNMEVSAFGSDEDSDSGDVWILTTDKGASEWQKDSKVMLKHPVTNSWLASHDRKYGRPISGQQEVCGKPKADYWAATEGVYFPVEAK